MMRCKITDNCTHSFETPLATNAVRTHVKEKSVYVIAIKRLPKKTLAHFLFFCSFLLVVFFHYYYTEKDRSTHAQITAKITRFLLFLLSCFHALFSLHTYNRMLLLSSPSPPKKRKTAFDRGPEAIY